MSARYAPNVVIALGTVLLGATASGARAEQAAQVDAEAATRELLSALDEGLRTQVAWLTPEERTEMATRMNQWLRQHLAGGVRMEVLQSLASEIRARPVLELRLGAYGGTDRREWLLRNVDGLKRALARWLATRPESQKDVDAAATAAAEVAARFGVWLARGDPPPPPEATEALSGRLEQHLLGEPRGCLWAPILRPPRDDEVASLLRSMEMLPAPAWRPTDYEFRAMTAGAELGRRVWEMQTAAATPTEEGSELAARRRAPLGPEARRAPWLMGGPARLEAQRHQTRARYSASASALAECTRLHPFLLRALLSVRDAAERRALILP